MEIVKQPRKAEIILASASQGVRDMVQDLKMRILVVEEFYESFKVRMHKEGFKDPEIWIVTDYVLSDLPWSVKKRRNFIKDLKPVKEMKGLEKISTASIPEARQEIMLIHCDFADVDKDPKRAKRRLCDTIMESDEDKGFDVQVLGGSILGFVPA